MKSQWWKRVVSQKAKATALRRGRQLLLEQLEDRCVPTVAVGVYSPIDEVGNNAANPTYGAAPADIGEGPIQLLRVSPTAYTDGVSTPSLTYAKVGGVDTIPSPRTISNDVFNQSPTLFGTPAADVNTVDGNGLSDFGYSFGQFMDHDMDLTPDQGGLPVPTGDAAANKDGNNGFPIPADTTNPGDTIGSLAFSRSVFDPTTETTVSITGASWLNGVATITATNTFSPGQLVAINGVVPAGYNSPGATIVNGVITPAAPFTILSVAADGSSFSYALATNPGPGTGFTGAAASSGLRQQTNVITSYLDLSQVYGSSQTVSDALRTGSGGLMKTSPGNMLPFDSTAYFTPTQIAAMNMANDSGAVSTDQLYAAGDRRANENTELTSLTTLFVRNHNFIATQLAQENPSWTDDQIFQEARKLNIAEYQNIIYTQYLPALLGPSAPAYTGYDPTVNASISTEFSTIAFRFGHSMLNNTVARDNNDGSSAGALVLAQDFFQPNLVNPNGATVTLNDGTTAVSTDIGTYLKGDADNAAQADDSLAVSSVRDLLFGNGTPPGSPTGEDLISRDIWRARDDGIGNYNQVRVAFGLPAITIDPNNPNDVATHGFDQITSNVQVQQELETAYAGLIAQGGNAGDIDPFVAGMAEDHVPGSDMGPLFTTILAQQFSNLENGDQFFYLNESFTAQDMAILHQGTTLANIITTNTGVTNLQANVFLAQPETVVNGTLFLVGGNTTNDNVTITPVGASNTGSTGIQVIVNLNGLNATTTYFNISAISFFGGNGRDNITVAMSITLPATIFAGDGSDNVTLGSGNNTVTLGDGRDNVVAGNGNNTVTLGNGNDNVTLADGENVVVAGSGRNSVVAGNGDNLIAAGTGHDYVNVGNGNNILIDGLVTGTVSGASLRQELEEWETFGAADAPLIFNDLIITYNTTNKNNLTAGTGDDFFIYTDPHDFTNPKPTDTVN